MFENIGEKIKGLAIVCTIIGCILSVVVAILLGTGYFIIDFLIAILGGVFSWICSFLLYGFGELIVQTTNIAKGNQRLQMLAVCQDAEESNGVKNETIEEIKNQVVEDYEYEKYGYMDETDKLNRAESNECPCCFSPIRDTDTECSYCGQKLK